MRQSSAPPPPPDGPPAAEQRAYALLVLAAALIGMPAAAAAALLSGALHELEHLAWHDLPQTLGINGHPWWWVVALPALAGAIVAVAVRLTGHGGHAAIDGLDFAPIAPAALPSILLACAASIALGPVVGPEAPLLALGLVIGGAAAAQLRRGGDELTLVLALSGAFAAISTVFGGPLPAALMLLEFVLLSGKVAAAQVVRLLLPGFVAAGTGSLVFTGLGDWTGLAQYRLALPGLPEYPVVQVGDLVAAVPIAVLTALLTIAVLGGAKATAARLRSRPTAAVLIGGGALVGATAVLSRAISGAPIEFVLFSGASSLPAYLTEGSLLVLLTVLAAKSLALLITAASFFRGGLIFPAVSLGVLIGVAAHQLVPGVDLAPAVVAGIASAAAAALRAPFFGALLASLLAGSAAADVTPVAILAAAIAWLVALSMAPADSASRDRASRAAGIADSEHASS